MRRARVVLFVTLGLVTGLGVFEGCLKSNESAPAPGNDAGNLPRVDSSTGSSAGDGSSAGNDGSSMGADAGSEGGPPAFCGQNGDSCSQNTDCCVGTCDFGGSTGDAGTCGSPTGGGDAGSACSICTDCASRVCLHPDAGGQCGSIAGCSSAGMPCGSPTDCCGNDPDASAQGYSTCSTNNTCTVPQVCLPAGSLCHAIGNACGSASSNCCAGGKAGCVVQADGVPRCQ